MNIELYHASKFGNGARVAEELKKVMEAKGHRVNVHHIKESKPKEIPNADLYIFGSPTRIGKPLGKMRRFANKVALPSGTKYAVFATHGAAVANKKTGHVPTDEEMERWRQTIPILNGIFTGKGLLKVAEKRFFVIGDTTMKGHLIDGWQASVEEFAKAILESS